jgi:HAMP domain-containing protein
MSLLTRTFLANAAVLATFTLLLLFTPIEISYPVTETQSVILVTGFVVSLAINLVLLRRIVAPLRRLTETMRSVRPHVKLVAEGYASDEIAATLVISKKTVEHHRSHVLEKLGMRDRVELTRYAIRRGLVEP